jgi:hypothetical protein
MAYLLMKILQKDKSFFLVVVKYSFLDVQTKQSDCLSGELPWKKNENEESKTRRA